MQTKTMFFVLAAIATLAISCERVGLSPLADEINTQQISEDYSSIQDPEKRWQAYGLENYVFVQQVSCFCVRGGQKFAVAVRDGKIIAINSIDDGTALPEEHFNEFKTIDELFAFIKEIQGQNVARFIFEYDKRFGYPTLVSVDYDFRIADEEIAYFSEGLQKVVSTTD